MCLRAIWGPRPWLVHSVAGPWLDFHPTYSVAGCGWETWGQGGVKVPSNSRMQKEQSSEIDVFIFETRWS